MQLSIIIFVLLSMQHTFAAGDWEEFKTTYGKIYKNTKEENFRKQIFEKNVKLIEEHNRKYEQGLSSFSVKLNKLADRTREETHPSSKSNQQYKFVPQFNVGTSFRSLPREEVPDSIDWRDYGVITPVPDQLFCQSCWAFAAVGAVEAHMAIYRKVNVSLSQQNLVECVDPNFTCNDYLNPDMLQKSYEYITINRGIDTADAYPYVPYTVEECRFTRQNVGGIIEGYGNITTDDEEELKAVIGTIGPVSVTITTDIYWDLYSGGVFYSPDCMNTTEIFNHAVVVVGYGTENGEDYWLARNSWGPWFGEDGYIKMARNRDNNCGIATLARYPIMMR